MDFSNLPRHIAIIPDGNRRWAKANNLHSMEGHLAGYKSMVNIVAEASKLKIPYLTFFCFSTENQSRSEEELGYLSSMFKKYVKMNLPKLLKNNIKLNVIGNLAYFDEEIRNIVLESVLKTQGNTGLTLTIALNYGGRDEIVRAVKLISDEVLKGHFLPESISEELFSSYLYTKDIPSPDLLIRTSGEYRISNFLLWQIAYTELVFSKKFFPDFNSEDLYQAIIEFQSRNRRFGK